MIHKHIDIQYDQDEHHVLDIYTPHNTSSSSPVKPVLFFVHGGAWRLGSKDDNILYGHSFVGERFTERYDCVTVIPGYRLTKMKWDLLLVFILLIALLLSGLISVVYTVVIGGLNWILFGRIYGVMVGISALIMYLEERRKVHVSFPSHLEDIAASFKWMVENIEAYGGDPNRVVIAGHSAGGHMITLLVFNDDFRDVVLKDEQFFDRIKGIISVSGCYSITRMWETNFIGRHVYCEPVFGRNPDYQVLEEFSVLPHVKRNIGVPILMFNAQRDYHLKKDSQELYDRLMETENQVEWKMIPNTNHRTILRKLDRTILQDSIKFMEEVLN
eukprot:TRINITY_DN2168_c0_g2_i1.p1 TRINITY_DN2168_c0_g2~~TRINITY_DN2168_c0_g2_i1.p1  ORF type:complete len:329 (+),score=37.78 TRINITY_DN2168_c0_g2_i1:1-987(+)